MRDISEPPPRLQNMQHRLPVKRGLDVRAKQNDIEPRIFLQKVQGGGELLGLPSVEGSEAGIRGEQPGGLDLHSQPFWLSS